MRPNNDHSKAKKPSMNEEAIKRAMHWRPYAMKKHDATKLHYDLRLEWKGVLLSWALPVGPSCRAGLLREAIEMEDHDVANIMFEGVHETGPIMQWDCGIWEPHRDYTDIEKCLRYGVLRFKLLGEKLGGGWTLTRTKRTTYTGRPVWTFCKDPDSFASGENDGNPPQMTPKSILTGRTMQRIVNDWNNPKGKRKGQMNLF